MKYEHYHPVGVYCGSLYALDMHSGEPKSIIEHPAVLIDAQCDILHKWGNAGALEPILLRYQERMDKVNEMFPEEPPRIAYLISLESLPVEKQAYVICRMVEYTATGFIKRFYEKVKESIAEIWLEAEMTLLPINVNINSK